MSNRPATMEFDKHTKTEALKKYGWCCADCGIHKKDTEEGFLELHHILPVYFAVNYFPNIPHYLVSSVLNCRPLCSECHSKLHSLEDFQAYTEHALYLKNLLHSGFATSKRMRV